ncbi:MAG: acetyl-coenzyme A synthetase N-terminal domain-containing protein, partial [Candidatus Promineifilaceae bacterium]
MADEKEMSGEVYYPSPEIIEQAYIKDYDAVNQAALKDLSGFWGKIAAENFEWYAPWETVLEDHNAPFYKWFVGAK